MAQVKEHYNTGDIVKYSRPLESEKTIRFMVLEDRGDRVLVEQLYTTSRIAPTFQYRKEDIELVRAF